MSLPSRVFSIDTGAANCYLCRDEDGFTLIDSGMWGKHDLILARLRELGGAPDSLKRIVVTHADIDHAGSAAAVQAATGATVYAGAETARLLTQGRSPRHLPVVVQWFIDTFVRYRPLVAGVILTIEDGEVLPILGGLHALSTPGHTADHYAFFSEQEGVLFAGDALNTRDGRLQLSPERMTGDKAAAGRSARRLLALSTLSFACGHGPPLADPAHVERDRLYAELRAHA